MKFLLASLKTLTNSKSCSENRIKFLLRLSFALIGQFFLYIHSRLLVQLVSVFIEASRNFISDFLYKKTTENCEKHNRSFKKYCFEF
jgi:hypothetical protein